jgi:hypothetical protein
MRSWGCVTLHFPGTVTVFLGTPLHFPVRPKSKRPRPAPGSYLTFNMTEYLLRALASVLQSNTPALDG